jgi:phenylalanyl-tRNA synthetase beta subunit
MKVSYNWLKQYTPDLPETDKLKEVFEGHLCEVEEVDSLPNGDTIFDINILPDRACYLLSHQGVAKELSAILGLPFKDPTPMYKIPESQKTELKVSADEARRYSAQVVRGVKIEESPEWVKTYLESIGQRSINNIVDATNIVMHDCGQPCHAFDLDKIKGDTIYVRSAKEGENMTTLDKKEVSLREKDIVITDSESVLALAGVKGGTVAEVDENTTNIVLEVANFHPTKVRQTKNKHAIYTDSAKRFENNLSPELVDFAMKELTGLVVEMCPEAIFEEFVDEYNSAEFKELRKLSFSPEKVRTKLGVDISNDEIMDILNRYECAPEQDGNEIKITVPVLRLDLVEGYDIVEEIGRVIGYDKLAPVMPEIDFAPRVNEVVYKTLAVRKKLLESGYSEVITYSFGDKGKIRVLKSAEDKNYLRTNLSDDLKNEYEKNRLNLPLVGGAEVKMFEIGTVFPSKEDDEEIHVGWIDKKGVQEKTLDEFCIENSIEVGDSYEDVIDFSYNESIEFKPWSVYPFITRDVSVWLPNKEAKSELEEILSGLDLSVRIPQIADEFEKDGRVSYLYKLVFQADDRTLTDDEVNKIMDGVYEKIKSHSDWELR